MRTVFFAAALRFVLDIGIKFHLDYVPKIILVTHCWFFGEMGIKNFQNER